MWLLQILTSVSTSLKVTADDNLINFLATTKKGFHSIITGH